MREMYKEARKINGMTSYHTIIYLVLSYYAATCSFALLQPGPTEHIVCDYEHFEAECGDEEMILINNASYGRMHLNRCAKQNFGYLGCGGDVLHELHRLCSGRQKCSFITSSLRHTKFCADDLSSYLQVSFSCVKVITCESSMCQKSDYLSVAPPSGIFNSEATWRTGCGTSSCPWVISADRGQRLNFTLYDFSKGRESDTHEKMCYKYATIEEENKVSKDITACVGEWPSQHSDTERNVFLSESSTVTVKLFTSSDPDDLLHFALKYEVVGCPHVDTPRYSTLRHIGDKAVIKCNTSDMSWTLTCNGNAWVGQLGSCSPPEGDETTSGLRRDTDRQAYGMLVIVGLGITIGIVIGGLLLAGSLLYLKRKRRQNQNTRVPSVGTEARLLDDVLYIDAHGRYVRESQRKLPFANTPSKSPSVGRTFVPGSEPDYSCNIPLTPHGHMGTGSVTYIKGKPRDPHLYELPAMPYTDISHLDTCMADHIPHTFQHETNTS